MEDTMELAPHDLEALWAGVDALIAEPHPAEENDGPDFALTHPLATGTGCPS